MNLVLVNKGVLMGGARSMGFALQQGSAEITALPLLLLSENWLHFHAISECFEHIGRA